MSKKLIILGGGLSGLAAAIRCARYFPDILVLEQHTRAGGLNSYFYRNSRLFETGLHAITNYAEPSNKKAPLNRLFKQLGLDRDQLQFCQQIRSRIIFHNQQTVSFSNTTDELIHSLSAAFPDRVDAFIRLIAVVREFDPFAPLPFRSAKAFLLDFLDNALLVDMLLCPLMYYGSSVENDMDLSQFVIMFRAIYLEGMFRPAGTIKDFLDFLLAYYAELGGSIRYRAKAVSIHHHNNSVSSVLLDNGERIECSYILSTIGFEETMKLVGRPVPAARSQRLGFIETIYQMSPQSPSPGSNDTIIFFNTAEKFQYAAPTSLIDMRSGVLCFPQNFHNYQSSEDFFEIRTTHLANYSAWQSLADDRESYEQEKSRAASESLELVSKLIGNFKGNIVYENTFTPLTIERYTGKIQGAIYGSPEKIKDGNLGFANLFLAGTDQGFLGIVGSMLSGVSIVNQHILPNL